MNTDFNFQEIITANIDPRILWAQPCEIYGYNSELHDKKIKISLNWREFMRYDFSK
jgi:hypothetical protein